MPSTSMTHVGCKSKLRSVVGSFMHACTGNWVESGCTVVCYAQAFSARIECPQCMYREVILPLTKNEKTNKQKKLNTKMQKLTNRQR